MRFRRLAYVIAIAVVGVLLFSSCGATVKDTETTVPATTGGSAQAQTTAASAGGDLEASKSPKRFSTDLPLDDATPDYGSLDTSGYSSSTNDKGQTYLLSPDSDFSVTLLTDSEGEVYAYKYTDIANAVSCYYGSDGALYAVSSEDYSGEYIYYVEPDLTLYGMMVTTYEDFDTKVATVYDDKGTRVAAVETVIATDEKTYYDDKLAAIEYEEYVEAVKQYVDLRG